MNTDENVSTTPPLITGAPKSTVRSSPLQDDAIDQLIASLLSTDSLDRYRIDVALSEIQDRVNSQINAILHDPRFQAMERAWLGLNEIIERCDFRENIQVEILNATKDELVQDQLDSATPTDTALYHHVYTKDYGTYGGTPFALICANYTFGPNRVDIAFLKKCSAVAAMAHAPFIGNADPSFFQDDSLRGLPQIKDLESMFEGPEYKRWKRLRNSPNARYLGLCLPRFLLRKPYGEHGTVVRGFRFDEECELVPEHYLWGPASILFTCVVATSFAKYRWCPNIVGLASGGQVENLIHHSYETMGAIRCRIPTEIQLTDKREYELSTAGFIGLVYRPSDRNAYFLSANSVQSEFLPEGTEYSDDLALEHLIGSQLPHLLIATRIAHYVKVIQRTNIGQWENRAKLEDGINKWLSRYVVDMENPSPSVRARRPLRAARVDVSEHRGIHPGTPQWYRCHIKLRTHFKFLGADLDLSLTSTLNG